MFAIAEAGTPFPGSAFAAPIYRIPAVTRTQSGRIIVCYDVREDWRDLPADFDIALRASDDGGRTWTRPKVLRRHETGHGYGDASLTFDPRTETTYCWYVGSTGESYFSARAGGAGLELWLAASRDDGRTWEHRDMSSLRPAHVAGMFCSSGNGGFARDGRLFQTFVLRIDNRDFAAIAWSSDNGETWELGKEVGPDCDECKAVELADGSVLLHARSKPARREARAPRLGESFEAPVPNPTLTDPACNGGLARVGGALVASLCDDPSRRRNLSLHVSTDEGATWSPALPIDSGAAAYSAVVDLGNGRFGVVWEADNYRRIVFRSYSLEDLGVTASEAGGALTWDPSRVRLPVRAGAPGAAEPPVANGRTR